MLRKFINLQFGIIGVEEIFKAVFVLGMIPLILINIISISAWGRRYGMFIQSPVSVIYGIVILLFFVLVSIVVWKILCELLFLVFKSLEVFIHRNEK